jgi:putative zinc finger protein
MSAHVRQRMSAYIDRELPPSDRAGVESHLRECAECAREVDELRAVDALARGSDFEVPAGYFDVLPGRLRAKLSPPARAHVPGWALALAAGLAVAVIAPIALREGRTPAPEAVPPASDQVAVPAPEDPRAAASGPPSRPAPAPEVGPQQRLARRERADEPATGNARMKAPGRTGAVDSAGLAAAPDEAKMANRRAVDALASRRVVPPPASSVPAAPATATATEQFEMRDEAEEEPPLVSDSAGPERDAAGRPPAPAAPRAGLAARSRPGADDEFRALSGRAAQSAADARALRDAWDAFVRKEPEGPHADDARVRALEAGAAAWRLGGQREDRDRVVRDGRVYLRRPDAGDKERVRALLAGLEP